MISFTNNCKHCTVRINTLKLLILCGIITLRSQWVHPYEHGGAVELKLEGAFGFIDHQNRAWSQATRFLYNSHLFHSFSSSCTSGTQQDVCLTSTPVGVMMDYTGLPVGPGEHISKLLHKLLEFLFKRGKTCSSTSIALEDLWPGQGRLLDFGWHRPHMWESVGEFPGRKKFKMIIEFRG